MAEPQVAALTLEIGPPPSAPTDDITALLANPLMKYLRAYYELLDGFRVVFVEPAKPTEFFGYHPLTPTDSSAFDEIVLDIDFYEFIAGNINLQKSLAPYFGVEEKEGEKSRWRCSVEYSPGGSKSPIPQH